MSKPLFAAFVIWLFLLTSLSGVGTEHEAGISAQNCDQSSQRKISLSVVNKEGGSVDNLRPEDLTISENKGFREILKLERRTNESLSVTILIDTSASQQRTLAGTKLAAQKFVESILRSSKDRAALVSFTGQVPPRGYLPGGLVIGPTPPSRAQILLGATAIWDAIWATVDRIQAAGDSRRVIVLLTDGEDTISKIKLRDAIEHAGTNNVAIFSIGIADGQYTEVNRDSLKKLSEETGGRSFFPKRVAELDGIFLQTAQAFQSQYLLSYCAANQKPAIKPLKIEIEVKNPQLRQSNLRLSYPHYAL